MSSITLSAVVQANPDTVNASLEKLSCSTRGISEIDIYPSVLSALTAKGAPRSVAERARAVVQLARTTRALPQQEACEKRTHSPSASSASHTPGKAEDSYQNSFNVGIAMTLHTVLLSRNRIGSLLGIVQFKHCVRLSLLGNCIRTIEDCEPLALLPDLQYLSLEFNPVTQLPHYRAHLLRICSWPHDLTTRTCRLRKLDRAAVTTTQVKHAVLCLQREATLLPELQCRMQLLAFAVDVETRTRVHDELRQRGFAFQQLEKSPTLETALERGATYALDRMPVSGAAHLVRLLVRDRHHLANTTNSTLLNPSVSGTTRTRPADTELTASAKTVTPSASASPPLGMPPSAPASDAATATFSGFDSCDNSVDVTNLSTVTSCSLFTDQSEDHAEVLQSLSHMLSSRELEWSKTALRRADAVAAKDTCKEWSRDAFRQTVVILDVRLCTVLLRVARRLGQSLTSLDVDHLCQVWLHAVSHHSVATASSKEEVCNVTGPRRLVVKASSSGAAFKKKYQRVEVTGAVRAVVSPSQETSGKTTEGKPEEGNTEEPQPLPELPAPSAQDQRFSSPKVACSSRLPVESEVPVRKNVCDVGEQDGCLSSSFSDSFAAEVSDVTVNGMEVSATSVSSEALTHPRCSIPQPTPVDRASASRAQSVLPRRRKALRRSVSLKEEKHDETGPSTTSAEPVQAPNPHDAAQHAQFSIQVEKHRQLGFKKAVFQQWCTALRRRWQSRILTAYIREKVSDAAEHYRLGQLRSPSWCGLLAHVTYLERKRAFFVCWHRRALLRQACRAFQLRRVFETWRTRCVASSVLRVRHDSDVTRQEWRSKESVFRLWKRRAEQKTLQRCSAARQRVLVAETPRSPDTFLSLHPRSFVTHIPTVASPPSPSPIARRQLLEALLTPFHERNKPAAAAAAAATAAQATPSALGFRPCLLTKYNSSVQPKDNASTHTAAGGEDAEAAGLSPASSPSSGGISVVGVAPPPFVRVVKHVAAEEEPGSARETLTDTATAKTAGDKPSHAAPRELSPPPAIRILFPSDTAKLHRDASPAAATRPRTTASVTPTVTTLAMKLYRRSQPSQLPSMSAARRAIVPSTSSPQASSSSSKRNPSSARNRKATSINDAPPYSEGDVEALVLRAKQLESDRSFLLDRLRHLQAVRENARVFHDAAAAGERAFSPAAAFQAEKTPVGYSPLPCMSDGEEEGKEELLRRQQREVCRLESMVRALRAERHELLKSVHSEWFRY